MAITISFLLNGLVSGLIATIVMTILMMIGTKTGIAPPLKLPERLGKRLSGTKNTGILAHFGIGAGFGLLYTLLLGLGWLGFSTAWLNGALYGILPWLGMMLIALPQLDAGMFGLKVSRKVPAMSLVLHLVYGGVLGWLVTVIPL